MFVLISAECVLMCSAIDNVSSCEICTIIHVLDARNMSSLEIHCELCAVYGQNVMNAGFIKQWCRMLKDG
jgi:hypothetical protein